MNMYTEFMRQEAKTSDMSAKEAVEKLRLEIKIRTVREVLAKACGLPENDTAGLKSCLVDRLMETTPGTKRESVDRKVRMWIYDGKQSLSKEGAIQLCFALHLAYPEALDLCCRLCGEGFHWRDPQEIVFLYSLLRGQSYSHAVELYNALKKKGLLKTEENEQTKVMTGKVRERVEELRSDEELETFFRENSSLLGRMHNTAYSIMMDFLSILRQPAEDDRLRMQGEADVKEFREHVREAEQNKRPQYDEYYNYREEEDCDREVHFSSSETMSSRELLSTYLYDKIINCATRPELYEKQMADRSFDMILEEISRAWPEETAFSRIVHREADVTRKLLILLFLATDGDNSEYEDLIYELEQTPEEIVKDRCDRMDTMLSDCGFSPLDPRAPFDWMILYCICAEDILDIDDRLRNFLSLLFQHAGKAV